jgi:hypothetical protein
MMKRIVIEIIRPVTTYTMQQLAAMDSTELRKKQPSTKNRTGRTFDLQPFYFAKNRKKVVVFQSPYDSRLEELEIQGESERLFEQHPIEFHPDGWPVLMSRHEITQPDKHQLLLPLKSSPRTFSE